MEELKKAYLKAKKENKEIFDFQGQKMYIRYAYYFLLNHGLIEEEKEEI